ncbi:sn-glycerol-3-phosphate ABC transporter ATP-binding protein UgpC [Pseudoduganella sp. DS3]|uniref:sn-glycerol-3-phosphate ABC transporter ATP-binding protein UgpC n=1 Tax=Pseudoduganella guangdongensis TaxID=2692179 RepID=A0A6N9HE40_9BURK|nr:sn-glycerol-3-phosphate ABC transporter ATP-binding protein UgpC [Pseudoduganella guangdongensis]MYN01649.1 sn-glycerol-3-phosphate ABC transporter ATP-binding protein UgpC [Pseudoduganella guangdongensis]
MAAVSLRGIAKRYGDNQPVIRGIDLDIADGEFTVFVGPSGCGKSTLLRMIAGLEDISEGELHIGGKLANQVPPAQRGLAMVFQSYALYPHMTVFENMAFGLKLSGMPAAELRAAVERAAATLQIGHLLERKPKELSGGQRQRVAIGRAIVRKPQLFLFDEPLSNLDAGLRVQMRLEIGRLQQELGTTTIYVTHDQVEAMTLGQRIVVFNGGRIEQAGTPHALYNAPANLFVAGFLGSPRMNFIPAEVVALGAAHVAVLLPGGAIVEVAALPGDVQRGARLALGVRPEHLQLRREAYNAAEVAVSHVEYLGDQSIVYARLPGMAEALAAKVAPDAAPPAPGTQASLFLPPERCMLFGADGSAFARA